MTTQEIRGWLLQRIEVLQGVAPGAIDAREPFSRYGLHSLAAARIAVELSAHLGRPISPTLLWKYPTIEQLARFLTDGGEKRAVEAGVEGSSRADDSVAIIGMACRFPGAPSPAAFWQLLCEGRDAISDVPARRWSEDSFARLGMTEEERRAVRRGGFLDAIDTFDPLFFGLSPREAELMDPQQRLMLELCWEAFEDAGIVPQNLKGSRTGVFAATIWSDYAILMDRGGPDAIRQHTVTGWHHSILANRVSYLFGLQGPSFAVDSACSSGLVTAHLACESLRRGESTLALVGAVNLDILPESALAVAKVGALSADGRCYSFDARANGYVRGEGGGVVLLKLLSKAIADGDPIHCVIRGSAVNNDGPSNGMTAPNPQAQEALLRSAYRHAGIDTQDVQYVEAHGTGTPLGDPIEAMALGATLGEGRPENAPLIVGSAKTNVGHLEGAAGIVGLIKTALSIEHGQIPPSLHFERANPLISLGDLRLDIPTKLRPWPAPDRHLIAGVSSFGLGGTNAHVVLEEWPTVLREARSSAAPRGGTSRAVPADIDASRGVVFVFPGQGAQWHGMARALLQGEPVFRSVIEQCDGFVRKNLGWSLIDELCASRGSSRLDRIDVSLPAIISIDIAVAALWRSWGIEPAAVVGNSTGEIAAAHVCGALDLEDTMRIICAYGRLIDRLSGKGAMALVELGWEGTARALEGFEGRVFPAIQDSVATTVVAGEPAVLDAWLTSQRERGVVCRRVNMNVAPHCPLVDSLRGDLLDALAGIRPRRSEIPLISEVTGAAVDSASLDAMHWVRNFGDQALFSRAVDTLIAEGHRVFLDVGPHPITRYSVEANLRAAGLRGVVLASLSRGEDERTTLRHSREVLTSLGCAAPLRVDAAHRGPWLVPISARSKGALSAQAESYRGALSGAEGDLHDIAYTAGVRRSHHEHRIAVVGASKEEIAGALAAYARGEAPPGLVSGEAKLTAPKVVFVFPGQGLLWIGMAQSLLQSNPAFREAMTACEAAIQREAGFSVLAEIAAGEGRASRLSEIDVAQPVLFALEVALAASWRSFGVRPDAIIGHSMGEVAAAHVSGALSLDDAAKVICIRSRLLRTLRGQGGMAMVELSMVEAEQALAPYAGRLSVAACNGPRSTVIAGDLAALEALLAELLAKEVFCQRVKVDVASHSPQTEPLAKELRAMLPGVSPKPTSVAMFSTVTGARLSGEELVGEYWAKNLRNPVLFAPVVKGLIEAGHTLFVEMSPHPSLLPAMDELLAQGKVVGAAVSSLRFRVDDQKSLLESLGRLYVFGHPVDFQRIQPEGGRVVELPTYPFQRERFWVESSASAARVSRTSPHAGKGGSAYVLLGAPVVSSTHADEQLWEQTLSLEATPYLGDHKLQGEVVFPGAGYVEMALAAGREKLGTADLVIEDIVFDQMLALSNEGERITQAVLTERGAGCTFQIASRASDAKTWTKHAAGSISVRGGETDRTHGARKLDALKARLGEALPAADHYERMRARQIDYGPAFQGILELSLGEGEALGRVRLPAGVDESGYMLHPALLDACLQVTAGLLASSATDLDPYVPIEIKRLALWARPPRQVLVVATKRAEQESGRGDFVYDLEILNDEGDLLVELSGLRVRRLGSAAIDPLEGCVHEVEWRRVEPLPDAELPARGAWLLFVDKSGFGAPLEARLSAKGQRCIRVIDGHSYERLEPDFYRIDPANAEDYRRLLREALGDEGHLRGAVHLFSLDAAPLEATTLSTLEADLKRGAMSAAYLAQALVLHGFRDMPRLFLVTRGAQALADEPVSVAQAPLLGLARTMALEHAELRCARIDLDATVGEAEADLVVRELAGNDGEDQIALRRDGRHVARIVRGSFERALRSSSEPRLDPADGRPFELYQREPGVIDGLSLRQTRRLSPGPGEVLIDVEAAGLNFLDVLQAVGALPGDALGRDSEGVKLGFECAGRISAVGEGVTAFVPGQEVVALAERSLGSYVLAQSALVIKKPGGLAWEQAATLPVAFLTAHYALRHVGRLEKGERVLIHAGAGGVGLAAIQCAQHVGAEIFATAGSDEKRAYLRSLGVAHVLDSRSLGFVDEIKRITKGEGVDVVLNSLSGEFIPASLSLLRDYGRFLEIGKRDYFEDKQLGLRPFLRNLSFSLVDLRGLFLQRPARVGALFTELAAMLDAGALRPLPTRVFPVSRVADAFNYMAQAKHIGKIAISLKDPEVRIAPLRKDGPVRVRSDRSYLITGGLTGLGLSLARFLVEQGVRHLALVGRRSPNEEATRAIDAMKEAGAQVLVVSADASRNEDMKMLFARIDETMPKLAGIVHAAMVLDDHTLLEQTEASFRKVFAPKALGAWNLHELSEGRDLDFFIMYSSVSALLGSPGQGNYTAANAMLDALAHERARRGLASMSIQWGGFAEIGLAAAADNRGKRLESRGIGSFTPAEGLLAFERLLARPRAEVSVVRFDVRQWAEFYPDAGRSAFFGGLLEANTQDTKAETERSSDLRAALAKVGPEEGLALLEQFVAQEVGYVLRLDPSLVKAGTSFHHLGIDSLMKLELRNRIRMGIGFEPTIVALSRYDDLSALASYLLQQVSINHLLKAATAEQSGADEEMETVMF